jgi:hypothetical protein
MLTPPITVHLGGPSAFTRVTCCFDTSHSRTGTGRVCSVVYFWRESKPERQPLPTPVGRHGNAGSPRLDRS